MQRLVGRDCQLSQNRLETHPMNPPSLFNTVPKATFSWESVYLARGIFSGYFSHEAGKVQAAAATKREREAREKATETRLENPGEKTRVTFAPPLLFFFVPSYFGKLPAISVRVR
ncbi:hypothetical protein PUN28_014854 [Cardiocondyla obscurior]|uniref:Uncharacterized protein n=1 Tax=Cardiocondyla obscurior TaxID=286306 RepID=A0AAW2F079_9HYME